MKLTEGLFGNPTRWPQVLSKTTNRSRTEDWKKNAKMVFEHIHLTEKNQLLTWLIQGLFHPEKAEESAFVKLNDLLGDNVESGSILDKVEPVIVPRPIESFSEISEAAAAIAEVKVAVEAKEYDP